METGPSNTPRGAPILPWVTAGILLTPYATLALPFRRALEAQAAGILGLTLLLLVWGSSKRTAKAPLLGIDWTRRGIALWSLGTTLGLLIGCLNGNEPLKIMGQFLALGLLPLGYMAGKAALRRGSNWRQLTLGLAIAVAFASSLHLLYWFLASRAGTAPQRLFLSNEISIAGAAPLALLLLLGLIPSSRLMSWFRGMATILISIYLLGSGGRGAWLVLAIGVLIFVLLNDEFRRWVRRRWRAGVLVLALAVAAFGSLGAWLKWQRETLLPATNPVEIIFLLPQGPGFRTLPASLPELHVSWDQKKKRRSWLVRPFLIRTDRTYRLQGWIRGGQTGNGFLELHWLDSEGVRIGGVTVAAFPSLDWTLYENIGRPPIGTTKAELTLSGSVDSEGTWTLRRVEIHDLGPGWVAPWARQGSYLIARLTSLLHPLDPRRSDEHQTSVRYRLEESRRLVQIFRGDNARRRVWGRGLGATFKLDTRQTHYIHNFYLFLIFKLGVAGTLLLLSAVGLWLREVQRSAASKIAPKPQRRFLASVLAAWCAYLLWSTTSPEILDFRLAPIWGLLLALAPVREPEPRA